MCLLNVGWVVLQEREGKNVKWDGKEQRAGNYVSAPRVLGGYRAKQSILGWSYNCTKVRECVPALVLLTAALLCAQSATRLHAASPRKGRNKGWVHFASP